MFGNFGQLASLMKNLQNLKQTMDSMKSELASLEFNYKSPCGNIEIFVSGDFTVRKIIFDPNWAAQNAAILPDLLAVSINAALLLAKEAAAKKVSEAAGGLNLPGIV